MVVRSLVGFDPALDFVLAAALRLILLLALPPSGIALPRLLTGLARGIPLVLLAWVALPRLLTRLA